MNEADIFTIDDRHWIEGATVEPTPFMGGVIVPRYIILHWTAGGSGEQSVRVMERLGVSAHIVLDRDGVIYQTAPFNHRCSHAGRSRWKGIRGLNSHSIGVEVANYGPLTRQGDGTFRNVYGGIYDGPKPIEGFHENGSRQFEYWEPFSLSQKNVLEKMVRALRNRYETLEDILGHHEISPGRKIDVSPEPTLGRLKKLFSERRDQPVITVNPKPKAPPPINHYDTDDNEPVNLAAVQQALNMSGAMPRVPITGTLTSETKYAIRQFQELQGLKVDGIAGPRTRMALGLL